MSTIEHHPHLRAWQPQLIDFVVAGLLGAILAASFAIAPYAAALVDLVRP